MVPPVWRKWSYHGANGRDFLSVAKDKVGFRASGMTWEKRRDVATCLSFLQETVLILDLSTQRLPFTFIPATLGKAPEKVTHIFTFFLISYQGSAADRRVNAGWAASQRAALSSSPKLYSLGWVIRLCSVMSLDSRTGTTVVLSVGLLRDRVNGGSLPTQCLNMLKYDNMRAGTSLALVSSYPCPHPKGHCALSIPRDAVCPHLPTLNWGCFLQWIAFPITADHEAAASQLLLVYTHELGLLLVARPS